MVNSPRDGGCGGARAVYSAGNASATEVAIHELGHSLALLADEYGGDPSCAPARDQRLHGLGQRQLAGVDRRPRAPWEGAKYYNECIYRPVDVCEMRALNNEFCPVCTQQWALTFFGHPT